MQLEVAGNSLFALHRGFLQTNPGKERYLSCHIVTLRPMKDPGDIIAYLLLSLATVLIEVFAVEPLLRALILDVDYPGVQAWVIVLIYLVLLIGSFVGILNITLTGLKKLFS